MPASPTWPVCIEERTWIIIIISIIIHASTELQTTTARVGWLLVSAEPLLELVPVLPRELQFLAQQRLSAGQPDFFDAVLDKDPHQALDLLEDAAPRAAGGGPRACTPPSRPGGAAPAGATLSGRRAYRPYQRRWRFVWAQGARCVRHRSGLSPRLANLQNHCTTVVLPKEATGRAGCCGGDRPVPGCGCDRPVHIPSQPPP